MDTEIITNKQGVSIGVLFVLGSAIVLSPGGNNKQDIWITILISMLMAIPAIFVYSRVLSLYPEMDLFEILNQVYGKVLSRIIAIFFFWYCFHLGALVLRNFSEFMITVSLPETPQAVIIAPIGILCIWLVKGGIEILGRWAGILFPIMLITIITQISLSMTQADFDNLKPVLYNGIQPLIGGAYALFCFPFAEIIVLTMVFRSIKNKFNTYKVFYISLLVGGLLLMIAGVRNILVLGAEDASLEYFPSYEALSVVNIANFFQRIEVVVTVLFILAGIVKISACLFAASRGVPLFLILRTTELLLYQLLC